MFLRAIILVVCGGKNANTNILPYFVLVKTTTATHRNKKNICPLRFPFPFEDGSLGVK